MPLADGVSQQHGGLPWFLDDMRPQGFMGRTFAHAHPELQLGSDSRHWNDDDVLRALGGSSAGGEQPKFCTLSAGRSVIRAL